MDKVYEATPYFASVLVVFLARLLDERLVANGRELSNMSSDFGLAGKQLVAVNAQIVNMARDWASRISTASAMIVSTASTVTLVFTKGASALFFVLVIFVALLFFYSSVLLFRSPPVQYILTRTEMNNRYRPATLCDTCVVVANALLILATVFR